MGLKLSTSGGGAVHLEPASSIATDVTLTVPVTGGEIPLKDGSGNISTAGTITATSFVGDGASLTGIAGGFSNVEYITASTTWTVPAGVTKAKVTVIGGGGGGANNTGAGGNGGAAVAILTGLSGSVSVTIGAGGAASNSGNGSAGGTTSFGSFLSATGGTGGTSSVGGPQNCGAGTVNSGTTLFRSVASKDENYFIGYSSNLIAGSCFKLAGSGAPAAWTTSSIYAAGAGGRGESGGTSNDAAGGMNGIVIVEY